MVMAVLTEAADFPFLPPGDVMLKVFPVFPVRLHAGSEKLRLHVEVDEDVIHAAVLLCKGSLITEGIVSVHDEAVLLAHMIRKLLPDAVSAILVHLVKLRIDPAEESAAGSCLHEVNPVEYAGFPCGRHAV